SFLLPILAGFNWTYGFIPLGLGLVACRISIWYMLVPKLIILEYIYLLLNAITMVISTFWLWKIFEKRGYDEALTLLFVIPAIPM
ncbi:MAG: hypothetical protein V1824_03400, partial [archaeon]